MQRVRGRQRVKRHSMRCRYTSPGRSIALGKFLWLGASGKFCGSMAMAPYCFRGPVLPGKTPSQCSAVYICMPASVVHTSMVRPETGVPQREAVLHGSARAIERPAIVVDAADLSQRAEVIARAGDEAEFAARQQQVAERQIMRA